MNKREISPPKLNLSRPADPGVLSIDLQAFFDFSFWMAEELEDLVARYQPEPDRPSYSYDIPLPGDDPVLDA